MCLIFNSFHGRLTSLESPILVLWFCGPLQVVLCIAWEQGGVGKFIRIRLAYDGFRMWLGSVHLRISNMDMAKVCRPRSACHALSRCCLQEKERPPACRDILLTGMGEDCWLTLDRFSNYVALRMIKQSEWEVHLLFDRIDKAKRLH